MVAAKTNNAIVPSPFSTNSQDFFIVGGYGPISQTEVLTESGWQLFTPSFPVTVYHHCLLLLNSTAAIVIGGIQNTVTTANTYIITNGNRVMFFDKILLNGNLKTEENSFIITFSIYICLRNILFNNLGKLHTVLSLRFISQT